MKKLFIYVSILILTSIGTLYAKNYSGGTGTAENPYQISTLEDLRFLSENGEPHWNKNFIMTNDIDASDTRNWNEGDHDNNPATPDSAMGWQPIGDFELYNDAKIRFTGNFNGNNNNIIGLYINRPKGKYVGLFGIVYEVFNQNKEIANIGLVDCSITGDTTAGGLCGENSGMFISNCKVSGKVRGRFYIGGLCGFGDNARFENCHVNSEVTGLEYVGGLCGYDWSGLFRNCFSSGSVTGVNTTGGLCGFVRKGRIRNCYTSGSVTGAKITGGLCGLISEGDIWDSYSIASVSGSEDKIAGFCGSNVRSKLSNCYSTGRVIGGSITGGLVSENYSGSFNSSFWDIETSKCKNSRGGTGLLTTDMKTKSTFTDAGWDFGLVWNIDGITNNGYPFLRTNPVSVEEENYSIRKEEIFIYPNPTQDIINIKTEGYPNIEIYNMQGLLLLETRGCVANVSHLPDGSYILILEENGQKQKTVFIKNN